MVNAQAPAALPGTHCTGGWVSPGARLDRHGKSRHQRGSKPGPYSPKQTAIPSTQSLNLLAMCDISEGGKPCRVPSILIHQYCQCTHLTTLKSLFTKRRIKILSTFRFLSYRKTKTTLILQSSALKRTGQWGFPFFFFHTATQRKYLTLYQEANKTTAISKNTGVFFIYIYRVSQEECARLWEGVPYVKVYRYNPKHLCPQLNGYGDNGQRSLKL